MINNSGNYVRLVTSIIANISQPTIYYLDNGKIILKKEELTRVKPDWNVGELARYNGKVYKVEDVKLDTGKFVYTIDNQVVPEDKLEYPRDISQRFRYGMKVKVNHFAEEDMRCLLGATGTIDFFTYATIHFIPDYSDNAYSMDWEAVDVIEEKVEPYNAELICVEGGGAWQKGELAKVIDNHFCFRDNLTDSMGYFERKVYNLNDVNDIYATIRFAEIKETIDGYEEKDYWNGKIYVVNSSSLPFEKGKMYIVTNGVFYDKNGYEFGPYNSFKEIQRYFSRATLIEVKE